MSDPVAVPELAEGPSFAPTRRRKVAEPNPYDGVIAELAAAVDEAGFSATRVLTVDSIDEARKQRSLVRKAAKAAGVTSKVKFGLDPAGPVEVRFGIVPKKVKPGAVADGTEAAPAAPEAPAEAPAAPIADPGVDF